MKQFFNLSSFSLGCLLIFISCVGFYSFGNQTPALLKALDNRIMDVMFKIRGPIPDSGKVVIIDIDEKSLKNLGQWPWPRNILANIINNINKNGALAIGFDIVFAEKDRSSPLSYFKNLDDSIARQIPDHILSKLTTNKSLDNDYLFGEALSTGPTVLGYAFLMENDGLKVNDELPFPSSILRIKPDNISFQNLPLIPAYRAVINHASVSLAQSEGFFNVFTDDTGTTRQVPLMMSMDNIPYPSLALEIFRVGMKIPSITIQASNTIKISKTSILGIHIKNRFIPTDSFGQIFLNYRGPANTFKYISAVDVLTNPDLPALKDKFVIIGSSSTGLFDLKTTPFSVAVPGIEINATIIDNLINGDPFIYDIFTEIGLIYFLLISGGLLLSLILSMMGPLVGSFCAMIFFTGSLIWNYYYFFLNNQHVGITYPLMSCAGILLVISVFNAFREGKTKRFIQKAFSHYVAPDVVTQLLKNPSALGLQGEERELSILFLDIRGFTSISEKMSSHELGNFMNDFLTRMSRIIMKNNGTVDKFIGDAIMAFWGAPRENLSHAVDAVETALQLKSELTHLHTRYKKQDLPKISVGIGINSGIVSVGNFGSKDRFDYTVMGDNVNLASRLEGANKNYGTTILISENTKNLLQDTFFCRYIDKVKVKGRQKAVDLYEPILKGIPGNDLAEEVKMFENGISEYQNQNFHQALSIMKALYENHYTPLYKSYLDRINGFINSPPANEWDGEERRRRQAWPHSRLTRK
ncbi:MAG: adenylate/guanylate cyclase domain-containing protein [Desulfobacteraceae bacterium]|nr:adenylate/guanylate cyclase domain-containing protein [Desulfobacteraceae bacterium]